MNLLNKIYRYSKLLKAFSIFSIQDQMAYPLNFWLAIITKSLRVLIIIIFFKAIYLKVNNISGWDFGGALIVFATFSTVDFLANVTFARNFSQWFSRRLRSGAFDYQIIRPVNLQFVTAFSSIDFMDLASIFPILVLYYYGLTQINVALSISNVIIYFIMTMNALFFLYSFTLVLAAINFWTIQSNGLWKFTQGVTWMAKYPTDIYFGVWSLVFNFIIPISFIATWPAKAFLGTLNWQNVIYSLVFTAVFFCLANKFWNFGLKHYGSASS